jgi:hypothetical protein
MAASDLLNYMAPALTNVSVGYKNRSFYGETIAPVLPVTKPTGRIWLQGKEKFRLIEDIRAPKAEANEVDTWSLGTIPFECRGHGSKSSLDDAQAAAADPGIDWEITTTENLTQTSIVRQEYDYMNAIVNHAGVYSNLMSAAVPSTSLSGTGKWSDYGNSNPLLAVENARTAILQTTGAMPNTLAVSYPVYQILRLHPMITDLFKYTQKGTLQPDDLKTVFHVDNFWVLDALYDTASIGGAPSPNWIWGNNVLLGVIPNGPAKREVALCYTLFWTFARTGEGQPLSNALGNNRGLIIRRYRIEAKHTDVIEFEKWYTLAFGDVNAGYVFKNVI